MKLWTVRHRALGSLRVFCYAVVIMVVLGAVVSRVVYARLTDGTLQVGRELEGLNDVLGSTKTVFVNGTQINVSTAFSDESPSEVLDRFESLCREHPQLMVRALADVPTALLQKAKISRRDIWRLGVVRKEEGDDGALTCFTDDRVSSLADLMDRLKAFERSTDLAEFGHFRYVFVRRTDKGTHVRTVWTDGEFNLGKMFPAQGDAEGFDSDLVPRPPHARRLITATSAQVPYSVHVYRSSDPIDLLRRFYEQKLTARGWAQVSDAVHEDALTFVKNGALCFVNLALNRTFTRVTVTETARANTPTEAQVVEPP